MQRIRQGSCLHHHEDEIMQFLYVKSNGDWNGEAKEGPGPPIFGTKKTSAFWGNVHSRFLSVFRDGNDGAPRTKNVYFLACMSYI